MSKFIVGFVLGLVVAAVGFSGIARIADRGVQTIQTKAKNWPSKLGKSNLDCAKSG